MSKLRKLFLNQKGAKLKAFIDIKTPKYKEEYPNAVEDIIKLESISEYMDWLIDGHLESRISLGEISFEMQTLTNEINLIKDKATKEYSNLLSYIEYLLGACFKYKSETIYKEDIQDKETEEAIKEELSQEHPNWISFTSKYDVDREVDYSKIKLTSVIERIKGSPYPRSFYVGLINAQIFKK
jgi:hypothetical protein